MNAKQLGARLLGEVEETNLHEILTQLQATLSATTPTSTSPIYFNFTPLDHIINTLTPTSTTPSTTTSTTNPNTSSTTNTTHPRPSHHTTAHPPIIELTSLAPATGKTHLLYHLLALCVTGSPIPSHPPATALVFDTDARFSIPRLAEIIRTRLITLHAVQHDAAHDTSNPDPATIEEALETALQNVHIFRPSSLASLVSTVKALPEYLLGGLDGRGGTAQHYSAGRKVGMVVLDGASAFFWQERMAEEFGDDVTLSPAAEENQRVGGMRREDDGTDTTSATDQQQGNASERERRLDKDLTTVLHAIRTLFNCPIIYTTITLSSSSTSRNNSILRLPPPLSALPPSFPTLRLLCTRIAVKKFPAQMSIKALLLDRKARQDVVEGAGFRIDVVGVRGEAGGGVGAGAVDGEERERGRVAGRGRMGFEFGIGDGGVVVGKGEKSDG